MKKPESSQPFSPAAQLMAIEVIAELLVTTSPERLGEVLTEYLRELCGARTVMVLEHRSDPDLDRLLHISPARRANLFSAKEIDGFCFQKNPAELAFFPEELPEQHPLRAPLLRERIQSMARYPLKAGGELIGLLVLFDLPDLNRIAETNQILHLLVPPIALAMKNALAFRLIEQQAIDLEQRVEDRTNQLMETQQLFQTAIDSSPFPIMIHDENDQVLQLSRGWTKLSGYTMADIPTLGDWTEKAYGERTGYKKEYIDNLFSIDQTVKNGEWTVTCKDGSQRIWEFQTTPLGDVSDGRRVLLSMAADITERKQAEDDRHKLESQLLQAQKMESIGHLAGGVAHDFNNMLGVILGHAELALNKVDLASPVVEDLEVICRAAKKSADLTRQLLTFARKQAVSPKVLDLNETVASMLTMLQRLIGENIELSWTPAANLWPVKLDPSQLDQIMANLCVNARDAIANTGRLTISTANCSLDESYCAARADVLPGDYVRIEVSDDGCGIDPAILPHIFEPFFTTKEVGAGTGLGLAMVFGAVKQNGGFLTVYSEPGHGTTFNIYLPRVESTAAVVSSAAPKALRGGDETILLVEDDEMLLRLQMALLKEAGYHVLATATTREAQALAQEHPGPIHLLISDVIMPQMNGRELREILQMIRPEMKVLFMSGYTADIISSQGIIQDGVHFLQKPFSLETLTNKVRDVLD